MNKIIWIFTGGTSSIETSVKPGLKITFNRMSVGGFQVLIKIDSKNASTVLASIDIHYYPDNVRTGRLC
jgi:hypothetical protein